MARIRPALIAVQIIIVMALTLGLAWSVIAAAPGPLKGVPATTVADSEPAETEPEQGTPLDDAASQSEVRLEYRGAQQIENPSEPVTSRRAPVGGQSAAGSSPAEQAETPVAAPRVDPPRSSRSKRLRFARSPYQIVASGRPRHSTDSVLAYDGDPTTGWSAGEVSPTAYAWFDLGQRRTIAGLRWFQSVVDGPVAIQISNDRQEWTTVLVAEQPVADSWQRADIGQVARFVRIVVDTERGGADLAEVEIFGPPGSEPAEDEVAIAQQQPVSNRAPSVRITGGGEQGRQAAEVAVVTTPEPDSEAVEISVNGETTRCSGGERCRVESRQPEIVEDCGDGTTTCTIRIGVSGGLAVCDASGGNRGRNSASGSGERCTAEASGGTVEVSDVNR